MPSLFCSGLLSGRRMTCSARWPVPWPCNWRWRTSTRRTGRSDLPEIEMGIGIHTGQVVLGNIGSPERMKYGVVGRHVNLTARIQSYTTGGQILISETTRREAVRRSSSESKRRSRQRGSSTP